MKTLFYCIVFIAFIACKHKAQQVFENKGPFAPVSKFIAEEDSGFITLLKAKEFLFSRMLVDTSESAYGSASESDTIGKYYKIPGTGNTIICAVDLTAKYTFPTHLLLEYGKDGSFLKAERYFHSIHMCCWNNNYDGFYKMGDYFAFRACGTGSGYCGSKLYIFNTVQPQDSLNFILEKYTSGTGYMYQKLNSACSEAQNELTFHYTLEEGKGTAIKSDRFDIKYIRKNNNWWATDSTRLRQLDF